jgi:hypothetical protein
MPLDVKYIHDAEVKKKMQAALLILKNEHAVLLEKIICPLKNYLYYLINNYLNNFLKNKYKCYS